MKQLETALADDEKRWFKEAKESAEKHNASIKAEVVKEAPKKEEPIPVDPDAEPAIDNMVGQDKA